MAVKIGLIVLKMLVGVNDYNKLKQEELEGARIRAMGQRKDRVPKRQTRAKTLWHSRPVTTNVYLVYILP